MSSDDSKPVIKLSKREQTRNRVILAAINCIYRDGFNAAHTNRIAENADVSWGVLQYHFGDKDGLLQAVLDHIFDDFTATINAAELNHPQLQERLIALIEVVWQLVSKPEYRVSMAILRNAGRDDSSTIDDRKMVSLWSKETAKLWHLLFADLIETPDNSETAKRIMFATLRGLADDLNPRQRKTAPQLKKEFAALSDALSFLLVQ
jgi:AcrR family transcriptional regulator